MLVDLSPKVRLTTMTQPCQMAGFRLAVFVLTICQVSGHMVPCHNCFHGKGTDYMGTVNTTQDQSYQNGECIRGRCYTDDHGDLKCDCTGTGFHGPKCDIDNCINNGPCVRGKCFKLPNGDPSCDCDGTGYHGTNCSVECPNGTFGVNCSNDCHCQEVCDKVNGSCLSNCTSGWQGFDCQQECQDGKFGVNCLSDCHCHNTSDCGNVSCVCVAGWRGDHCQTPDCSYQNPCGIHTCQELGAALHCSCRHGYENAGPLRCVDTDECDLGDTCGIHRCVNTEGSYECICRNDSYSQMAPQICVMAMKVDTVKKEESFFPK